MNENPIVKDAEPAAKKPYSPPKLVVYGDLRMITESMRRAGADGGVAPNDNST